MKFLSVLGALLLFFTNSQAQSTQDTIDFPYWMDMMYHRNVNFYQTKRAFDLYFSDREKVKGTGYKQFERWASRAEHDIDENGNFRPEDYVQKEYKKFVSSQLKSRGIESKWSSFGPFNNPAPANMQRGVGRINIIAYHPTDQNILYAGAPAGGFWYSTDKGMNWKNTSIDLMPRIGVSAIAVIPVASSEPIILIGTGDRDAADVPGFGVYVSYDGGNTFTASNSGMGNVTVNKLMVNPLNSNNIIAATESGIFKSYNKGQSWVKTSISGDFKDIHYHPEDTNYVYATLGGSFYRSTNGGNSWTVVTSGFASTSKRRAAIAVTKANPEIVYVITVNMSTNGMEGLYKSSNRGGSFTLQLNGNTFNPLGFNVTGGSGGQGFYDLAIESSPNDSNVVYVGGVNIFKSNNGGINFTCVAYWSYHPTIPWVHADIHYIGRNPLNNELYIGSDGGIDYSTNEGADYNNRNNGLAISQFYNLGISQLSKTKFITGAQDNGTSSGSSKTNWTAELGGDGMECEISHFDTAIMFGCSQYGNLQRTRNGGNTWNGIVNSINEQPGPWITPYQISPRVNNLMVAVYRNVWVSKNITSGTNVSFSRFTSGISTEGSAVRFSNANDNYVFVGWKDGVVRFSSNIQSASPTFTATEPIFGNGSINDIETSYNDVNTLYVARGTKIFKSTNLGTNWTNISFNLPNISIYTIVLDKNTPEGLYVGTDAGVYYKDSTMSEWILYSNGLSLNAPVRDLEIVYDKECSINSRLFAATYGRGLWQNSVYVNTDVGNFNITSDKGTTVCEGEKLEVTATGGANYFFEPSSDISILANDKFQISATSSNQYKFFSKNSNGKCEAKILDLIVNPKPTLEVTPMSKTIKKGDVVTATADGANTYEWTPVKTITGSNTSSQASLKPDVTTTYTLKGISDKGCESTLKITITVTNTGAIGNNQEKNIEIFPNPASEELIVKSLEPIRLKLIDIQGKVIYNQSQAESISKIQIKEFPIGKYFIQTTNKEGNSILHQIKIHR